MQQAAGRIAAIEANTLWIDIPRSSACGSCSARRGCGQALLGARDGAHRVAATRGPALGETPLAVGDEVALELPDGVLLEAAWLAWLLPLLLLVGGLLLGDRLGGSTASALGALGGLAAGWLVLRWHQRRIGARAGRFLPLVTARLAADDPRCPAAS